MATIADQKFVFFGQGGLSAIEGEGAHLIVHAALCFGCKNKLNNSEIFREG